MLGKLSLREIGTWAALWRIDPWGEERADFRQAITTYVLAEVNRNPKKKGTPYKPLDFMPYAQRDKQANNRELSARIKAAFKRM